MQIKNLLSKTLLVAGLMSMGSLSAWATTVSLYKQNFNSLDAVPSDWTQASGTLSLVTDGTNKYLQEATAGSGSRGAWYKGSEMSTAISGYDNWTIEFDARIAEGTTTTNYSQGVWILGSLLSQSYGAPVSPLAGVRKASNQTTYTVYVNAAATETTVNLTSRTWYHYIFSYDLTTKKLTLTIKSQDQSSTILAATQFDYDYTTATMGNLTGIAFQAGRYGTAAGNSTNGTTCIDNIEISTEATGDVSVVPSFALKSVDGASRTYTITNNNAAGTLYYTTALAAEQPEIGDAAYSSLAYASGSTVDVEVSDGTGNLYAYAVNGTATSTVVPQAVNAVALTLATPTVAFSSATANDGSLSDVVITVTAPSNGTLDGSPVSSLSYTFTPSAGAVVNGDFTSGQTYTPTQYGVLVITASHAGYTSSTLTIPVSNVYIQNYASRDFTTLTYADDVAGLANWSKNDEDWAGWAGSSTSFYTADNVYTIDHITLRAVVQYAEGWGFARPGSNETYSRFTNMSKGEIARVKTNSTKGSNASSVSYISYLSMVDGTTPQGSFSLGNTEAVQGMVTYLPAIHATIAAGGYGTIASAYPLDCANLPDGVKAYKVSELSASAATLEEVTEAVAAGTGLILEGTAGTYNIPVAASGTNISTTNKLQAAVTATTLDDGSFYILGIDAKFHKVVEAATEADRTVPAGKAYLLVSDVTSARTLTIEFGDKETGISTVKGEEFMVNGSEIYNLQGQRVAQPTKGLYIMNGKKVIIK